MKKAYFLIGGFVVLFFILIVLFLLPQKRRETNPQNTPLPVVRGDLKNNYNNLNKVLPGKSSISDVVAVNGQPASSKTLGSKTYFYYNTPITGFENVVVFENNVVIFALENVYGDYRGTYENFINAYGGENFVLYEKGSPFVWKVFLNNGLGVQTNGKEITALLYFVPQDENYFIHNIADALGLSKQPPQPETLR